MSSISRPLAGPVMTFDLAALVAELRGEEAYRRSGRAGRTLAKSGRFRVVLVVMSRGLFVGTHQADSPMTLQLVEGALHFRTGEGEYDLKRGELLFFGPGDAHDIRSTEESALLITISAVDDDFRPEESRSGSAGPAD